MAWWLCSDDSQLGRVSLPPERQVSLLRCEPVSNPTDIPVIFPLSIDSTFIRDLSTRHLINLTLDRGSSPIATAKPTNTSSDASDASNATTAKAIADEKVPEGGIRLIMKGRQFDLELFEAELGAQLRVRFHT